MTFEEIFRKAAQDETGITDQFDQLVEEVKLALPGGWNKEIPPSQEAMVLTMFKRQFRKRLNDLRRQPDKFKKSVDDRMKRLNQSN